MQCAATRSNLAADDCQAVALKRIEPDGSPTCPFPLHQVRTGQGWTSQTMHQAPALPTAPSARTGVPVKHALGLHSSSEDDDEPQQLVSGEYADEDGFEGGDTMAAMCIKRMERKGAAAGPPVICWARVQGLGRGQAAVYWHYTNQAGEVKADAPTVLILPIAG